MTKVLKLWVLISKQTGEAVVFDSYTDRQRLGVMTNTATTPKGYTGHDSKGYTMQSMTPVIRQQGTYARLFDSMDECIAVRDSIGCKATVVPKRIRTIAEMYKWNPSGDYRNWHDQDMRHAEKRLKRRISKGLLWKMRKESNHNAVGYKLV